MKRFIGPFLILIIWGVNTFGQNVPELPSRAGTVLYPVVNLSFGDFTVATGSSGGTVTVNTNNVRTSGGDVFLLNMGTPVQAAMFEFKLCPGRTITISYPTTFQINGAGASGGYINVENLTFSIDGEAITDSGIGYIRFTSHKGCKDIHRIFMGGRLGVGSILANPSGSYHNDIVLTVEQQ